MAINTVRPRKAERQVIEAEGAAQSAAPPLPLTDEDLEELFVERATPREGRLRIARIRKNLPSRAVRSSRRAGKLRYPSRKMGFVTEAEAFHTEFVAMVEWDFDDDNLEFFPQPAERLTITYGTASGRRVRTHITPDAFRITKSDFVFTECKTERELLELARNQPERYTRGTDGKWRSPPAEAAAAEMGCSFEVRSDRENNYVLFDNLELLRDFLVAGPLEVADKAKELVYAKFSGCAYVSAFNLVHVEPHVEADHLYTMLVNGEIYFPLDALRLADQERAMFFRSEAQWRAYELFMRTDQPDRRGRRLKVELRPHDTFTWNKIEYEIINVSQEKLYASETGPSGNLIELGLEKLDRLIKKKELELHQVPEKIDRSEAEAILRVATKAQLETANWRYEILFGTPGKKNKLEMRGIRSLFDWKRNFREALERWGNGFLGLIPKKSGNRAPKVSPATKELAVKMIQRTWETTRRLTRIQSYGRYTRVAKRVGLDWMSYQSYCKLIKSRSGHAQAVSRVGEKAAYDQEVQYLELELTTPRHGNHAWHIGHIDHTPLPLQLLLGNRFDLADTVWLTILTDAFDRKVKAYYLSFDEPSYRSCMMVIRDCVRRSGRFFQRVVSDQGPDFRSVYYGKLIGLLDATKHERVSGKPKFGSVCERIFGTTQTQFVTKLLGATDIVERHYRSISPEVSPQKHAVWLLDEFDKALEAYLGQIYHTRYHTGLDMTPNQAEALSLKSHGHRAFRRYAYDEAFIAVSCPEVRKGEAKVQPAGIKVNYRWFDGPELHQPGLLGTNVPARYDPWNGGIAYAQVKGEWRKLHSERYAVFSTYTERSIQFATEAMRITARRRGERAEIDAEKLAAFLRSCEGREAVARQQRNDAEAAQHRERNRTTAPKSPGSANAPSSPPALADQTIQQQPRSGDSASEWPRREPKILEDL